MTDLDRKLEVYKVFVSTIIASENRRQQASTTYLGMIAAIVTVVGAIRDMALIYPAVVTWVISVLWFLSIRYFRKLAQAKFSVIAEIEKDLPIAALMMEWREFRGERNDQIGLTHLEMILPILTVVVCTTYIVLWVIF